MPKGRKRTAPPHNMPEAVEMYMAGANSRKVADFLGIAPNTALILLREAGVPIRRPGCAAESVLHRNGLAAGKVMPTGRKPIQMPDNMPAAIKMYNSGASSVRVAKFLGVAAGTAIRLLREAGVEIRTRGFAAGSVVPQVPKEYRDDNPLKRPPVTPEYLSILRRRWAEKIPGIVATALQEAFPGERIGHVR